MADDNWTEDRRCEERRKRYTVPDSGGRYVICLGNKLWDIGPERRIKERRSSWTEWSKETKEKVFGPIYRRLNG